MTNHVLINNVEHNDVRVVTTRSAKYGDAIMSCITFPVEFRSVQAWYPILLQGFPDGAMRPVALFGFEKGENLFLGKEGWNAGYIPAMIRREPFQIGLQRGADGSDTDMRMLSVDMDHPRVNTETNEGEALFQPLGGYTLYLEEVATLVESIYHGVRNAEEFVATLRELDLLEAINMDIQLNDGSKNQLIGFHAINEDRFRELSGDTLHQLSERGFLMPAFLMMASLGSMSRLINFKNERL
jgi:hypothetical protein